MLAGRPAILHHHDPPWQRARFAHITELPPDDPAWRHVTINRRTRTEMAERGIEAVTIYNGFDTDPPPGDRDGTRVGAGRRPPTSRCWSTPCGPSSARTCPPRSALAEAVGGHLLAAGRAEEGYGPTLEGLLAGRPAAG